MGVWSLIARSGAKAGKSSKLLSKMKGLESIPLIGPLIAGVIPGFKTTKRFLGVNQWANKGFAQMSTGLRSLWRYSKGAASKTIGLKGGIQALWGGTKWALGKGIVATGLIALPAILGGGYLIKKLVGGIGDIFKPKGPDPGTLNNMPSFDPVPVPQQPAAYQSAGQSSSQQSAQRAALNQQKIDLMEKIAETKSEMIANQRRKSLFKPYQDSFNENVTKLYAKGKPTDEKIDVVIELLNTMNAIVNENRKISLHGVRLKENEVDYELMKSTELYRGLSRLQGQLNSANNEAAMARMESSAGMANMANQTKGVATAVKQQTAQAKAASAAKWGLGGAAIALLASHSGLLGSLVSGMGGIMSTITSVGGTIGGFLGSAFSTVTGALGGLFDAAKGIAGSMFGAVDNVLGGGEATAAEVAQMDPTSKEAREAATGGRPEETSITSELMTKSYESANEKLDNGNYLGALGDAGIAAASFLADKYSSRDCPIVTTLFQVERFMDMSHEMSIAQMATKSGLSPKDIEKTLRLGEKIKEVPGLRDFMKATSTTDLAELEAKISKMSGTKEGKAILNSYSKLTKSYGDVMSKLSKPDIVGKIGKMKNIGFLNNMGLDKVDDVQKIIDKQPTSWWGKIKKGAGSIWDGIKSKASKVLDWGKSVAIKAITAPFKMLGAALTKLAPNLAKKIIPMVNKAFNFLAKAGAKVGSKLASKGISILGIIADIAQAFKRFSSGDGIGGIISILMTIADIISIIPLGPLPAIGLGLNAVLTGIDVVRDMINDSEFEQLNDEIDEQLKDEKEAARYARDWNAALRGEKIDNAKALVKLYMSRKDIDVANKVRTDASRELMDLIKRGKLEGKTEQDVIKGIRAGNISASRYVRAIVDQSFDDLEAAGLKQLGELSADENADIGEADEGAMVESASNAIKSFFGDGFSMEQTVGGGQSLQQDVPYNDELGNAIAKEYKGLEGKLEYNQAYRNNTYDNKRRAADCSSSTRAVYKKLTGGTIDPGVTTSDIVNKIESGKSGFEWVTRGDIPMKVGGYKWADGWHNVKPLNSQPLDVSQAKPGDLLLEARRNRSGSKYSVGHVNIVTKAPSDANGTGGEYYSHGGVPKYGPNSRDMSNINFRKDLIGIARFNWSKATPDMKSKIKLPTITTDSDQNANKLEGDENSNSSSSRSANNSSGSTVSNSGNTYITNNYNTTNNSSIQSSRAL